MTLIGRILGKDEARSHWANHERTITEADEKRVQAGTRLEDEGFALLTDPTGENSINEPFYIITPSDTVLSMYEIYAYEKIGLPGISQKEDRELKKAHKYILAYSPEILDDPI